MTNPSLERLIAKCEAEASEGSLFASETFNRKDLERIRELRVLIAAE